MNRLSTEKRAQIIGCLVEGNSIRATFRMAGVAKNTVTKLVADIGEACSIYQARVMRDLPCKRIECDEIWSFVGSKQKRVPSGKEEEWGDFWTWVAIDADTKLVPSYYVGKRTVTEAVYFMRDVAMRLASRVQITTDGLHAYLVAVEDAFAGDVDYAMLSKIYRNDPGKADTARRYSPPKCIGVEIAPISGNPDPAHISTSYVERGNLTMRMGMRRFTRLTNAFGKKAENLAHAVSLHFMHYNFARPHKTLTKARNGYPTTPAMAAGLADHVWTCEEIARLPD